MIIQEQDIILKLAQMLYDNKAKNIICLDVRNVCPFTDFFLIAEGNVEQHVKSLARKVEEELQKEHVNLLDSVGGAYGDWVVLDGGAFFIHLFTSEMRDRYRLEEVWKEGKVVDLDIKWEKD